MATYVAVNKDMTEVMYDFLPLRERHWNEFWTAQESIPSNKFISPQEIGLPKGTIEKLIGRKLTWEDEPVELEEVK